jgi:hypothetical protein
LTTETVLETRLSGPPSDTDDDNEKELWVSCFEVYNNHVCDLFSSGNGGKGGLNFKVDDRTKQRVLYVFRIDMDDVFNGICLK